MLFTFVILNYKNYSDTYECINSILNNINYVNKHIILVDNASNDITFTLLKNDFSIYTNIHFIENTQNLGFAKGNNVGFLYAKNILKSDFICLLNNDTIINQSNFIDLCIESYKEYNYFVLGPSITSTIDNSEQNPHGSIVPTKINILKIIIKNSLLLSLSYFPWLYKKLKSFENNNSIKNTTQKNLLENVNLNGCCLIFSPLYINKKDGLYPNTFMYCEEEILFYQCVKENMKTLFNPQIKIFHKDGVSTNLTLNNNAFKKRRFYYKNTIKSYFQLLKLMFN